MNSIGDETLYAYVSRRQIGGTMRRLVVIGTLIASLLLNNISGVEAVPIDNFTTEAQANCAWGTNSNYQPPVSTDNNVYDSAGDWWNATQSSVTDNCSLAVTWFPQSSIMRYPFTHVVVSADETNSSFNALQHLCKDVLDPTCSPTQWASIWMEQATGYCKSDTQLNCIESLEAVDKAGVVQKATFVQSMPNVANVPSSGNGGSYVAEGGAPALWEMTTAAGKINLLTPGGFYGQSRSRSGKWEDYIYAYMMSITPVSLHAEPRAVTPRYAERLNQNGVMQLDTRPDGDFFYNDKRCLTYDVGTCVIQERISSDYRYKITLRMPDITPMFLNGNIGAPIITSTAITGGHRLVVEAAPVQKLAVATVIPKSAIPLTVLDKLEKQGRWVSWARNAAFVSNNFTADPDSTAWFEALTPYMSNQSTFLTNSWFIANSTHMGENIHRCASNKYGTFVGVVSSNATAYTGDPPEYDPKLAALVYKVGAPHYLPDGKTAAVGQYSLNIDASVLQCIVGADAIPESVQVGFEYQDGTSDVATVVVHRDGSWVRLAANNFHFSSPTIAIKFKKTSASTTAAKSKLITITCIKGKVKKKVTAAKPKCPVGWKLTK